MDAVVAHSEHGAAPPARGGRPRRPSGSASSPTAPSTTSPGCPRRSRCRPSCEGAEGPVVLCFGLLRPYKGIEILLEAFRQIEGAELWIVGNPRMDVEPLRALAAAARRPVRFLTRFVEDAEIPAIFRRADLVALPYLDAEHSGVLYTGLAFGKPLVLSAVGGFPEVAETGAARLVAPGDTAALAAALARADRRRRRPRRARRRRPRAPPPAPSPGTRPPASPSTSTAS